jgi:hypothetical protein
MYTAACEEDHAAEFEVELLDHASRGRGLLCELTSTVERLSAASLHRHELKELLRIMVESVEMVTMGITILNMHCSILPHNRWKIYKLALLDVSSDDEDGSSGDEDDSTKSMEVEESDKASGSDNDVV